MKSLNANNIFLMFVLHTIKSIFDFVYSFELWVFYIQFVSFSKWLINRYSWKSQNLDFCDSSGDLLCDVHYGSESGIWYRERFQLSDLESQLHRSLQISSEYRSQGKRYLSQLERSNQDCCSGAARRWRGHQSLFTSCNGVPGKTLDSMANRKESYHALISGCWIWQTWNCSGVQLYPWPGRTSGANRSSSYGHSVLNTNSRRVCAKLHQGERGKWKWSPKRFSFRLIFHAYYIRTINVSSSVETGSRPPFGSSIEI